MNEVGPPPPDLLEKVKKVERFVDTLVDNSTSYALFGRFGIYCYCLLLTLRKIEK